MTATRIIIALVTALLIDVQIVRNAAVLSYAPSKPALAAKFWPTHPATEISLSMAQIAQATRNKRPVPHLAFAMMADASSKEPLAPEPFLLVGMDAERARDGALAQKAFEAAQWRDPRSLAAAYFLADRYFRAGDMERTLREIATLARLSPAGRSSVEPYLVAYATNPANWPALRNFFQTNHELYEGTMVTLAAHAATVPAVLALAQPTEKAAAADWLAPLLNSLLAAGQYREAREIWAKRTGAKLRLGQLIYDSSFSDRSSPPPFNWTLGSSAVGFSERQPGGRLHLIFYGQEDGFLANELLLLAPGSYRLSMQLVGDPARAHNLNWSIWCDKAAEPISSVTLDSAAARGWSFVVPKNCRAQSLKLSGVTSGVPRRSDVAIARLRLERTAAGA